MQKNKPNDDRSDTHNSNNSGNRATNNNHSE